MELPRAYNKRKIYKKPPDGPRYIAKTRKVKGRYYIGIYQKLGLMGYIPIGWYKDGKCERSFPTKKLAEHCITMMGDLDERYKQMDKSNQ